MTTKRIDVHTHVVPSFWADELDANGGDPSGWKTPAWSPKAHLAYMDDYSIETSMLSLTAPSVVGWSGEKRREVARQVNEYVAELDKTHGRFGNLATVPLPDVDGAIAEAKYALDELNADGITLMSNYGGTYLGDESFLPLWEFLNEREAVVFVHPSHPQMENLPGVPGPAVDYPFDTTRTAVHMVYNGIPEKFPNVKIILSHAGGFVPYSVFRFAGVLSMMHPEGDDIETLLQVFRSFYFDTALSSGKNVMGALMEFADPERVLFGSDFPYAPAASAGQFNRMLDAGSGLSEQQLEAINSGNAKKLFRRYQ